MPRCYVLKKYHHYTTYKSLKAKAASLNNDPVYSENYWQQLPSTTIKTANTNDAFNQQQQQQQNDSEKEKTPINPTEQPCIAPIYYNNTQENQSGKCFLKFISLHCISFNFTAYTIPLYNS
ncbi:unnamed protein product [Diamesa serratosioi]